MPIRYSPNISSSRTTTPTANPLTVAITRGTPAMGGVLTDTYTLTATFSREVSTFAGGVIETYNDDGTQATHTFSSLDSTIYTITVTCPTNSTGTIRYRIPSNSAAAADDGTTGPRSEVYIDVNYDTRIPEIIRFERPVAGLAIAETEAVNVYWNVFVNGFADSDLSVSWADQNMLTGTVAVEHTDPDSQSVLNITYPDNSAGQLAIRVNNNAVERNVAPNRMGPIDAEALMISYNTTGQTTSGDTTPPTMEILGALTSPWRSRYLRLQFVASESITGFTQGDIMVSNASTRIQTFTEVSNTHWDVDFLLPSNINETVTFTVPVNSFEDLSSNANAVDFTRDILVNTTPVVDNFPGGTQICAETYTIDTNPFIQDSSGNALGGYFAGVMEIVKHGDNLYMVVQVMRKADGNDEPAYGQEAAGALVHVNLTSNSCSVIERYDHITLAPRSMVVHQNEVHLFYCSHYIYIDPPGDENWRESVAYVRKITSSNNIVDVARPYRYRARLSNDEDLHVGWGGGTASPMVSHDDDLHLVSGYGNIFDVTDNRSDASRYDNWQWQVLRQRMNRRVPRFDTNGRIGFDVLKEIAFISDAIIGFNNEGFFIKSRSTVQAELDASIDTSDISTIAYRNRNRDFPTEGMIVIGNEVFSYTGRNSVSFSGVTRAQEHTIAEAHMEGDDIYFINNALNLKDSAYYKPIDSMRVGLFKRHLYNRIKLRYGEGDPNFDHRETDVPNEQSIRDNGEEVFSRSIPLGRHQVVWADFIANKLLERFGELRYLITLELKTTTYLKPGDYMWLEQQEKAHIKKLCQVISVSQDTQNQSTKMELLTIN